MRDDFYGSWAELGYGILCAALCLMLFYLALELLIMFTDRT